MKIKRAVQTSHVDQLVREGVEEFANLRLKTNIGVNLFIFGIPFFIFMEILRVVAITMYKSATTLL